MKLRLTAHAVMGFLFCTSALFFIALQGIAVTSADGSLPTITNYYAPCANNTVGTISTFHGVNRDGKPPLDRSRRTYDFHCVKQEIYSPTEATVWGYTPKYGGVLLMQDTTNKVCVVMLGMSTFTVTLKQNVKTGDYLGTYGRLVHIAAVDGNCANVGFYNVEARTREHPIAWKEFGKVLAVDITKEQAITFVSLNPGGEFETF